MLKIKKLKKIKTRFPVMLAEKALNSKQCEDLIRVGSDNDGGYLISVSEVLEIKKRDIMECSKPSVKTREKHALDAKNL